MRNRGGREAILPLLVVLFTSALSVMGQIAEAAAGSGAPGGPPRVPPSGGESEAAVPDAAPSGAGQGAGSPAAASSASGDDAAAGAAATPAPAAAPSASSAPSTSGSASSAEAPVAVERRMVPSLSHDLQFGLAVMPGGGYRIVFPYKENLDCGDANNNMARVCTNRSPFFIDLQPSLGISESWDVLIDVRFGLEQNVFRHHEVFLMPGFRYWLDTQTHVKFYTTLQLAFDVTEQSTSTVSSWDLGVRNSNGLMVEIMRNFGAYFQFGETVGFVRWLSFGVDAGVGVQARVP